MSENKPIQNPGNDPLASLYRMSTTAGNAAQEYVAVNLLSVAALVLGLASGLVLLSNVLLVIPAVALVIGIAGIRQVRNSNGTQTGTGMAIVGILAAIAFSIAIGAREYRAWSIERGELAQINTVVSQLDKSLTSKDYPAAFALFTDGFKARKKTMEESFREILSKVVSNPLYGDLQNIKTNDRVSLSNIGSTGNVDAATWLVFTYNKKDRDPVHLEARLKKADGQWKFDSIPQLFPPEEPKAPPGAGGGGGGGQGPNMGQ